MADTKKLSYFDFTMIVISMVIGMGIFRTASTVANASDNVSVYLLSWVVGGLIACLGALTYAEIGSRFPVTGGYYRILAYAYHPAIAFSINAIILVSNASTLAGVVLMGAGYITKVVLHNDSLWWRNIFAIGAIAIFFVVNLFGIKQSAKVQNILMVIKIGMILVLICPVFLTGMPTEEINFNGTVDDWVRPLGLALVAVSFTFGGYQQTINFGGEVSNSVRILPKGIITAMVIIICLYLTVNLSYLKIIGFQELKTNDEVASTVITLWLGKGAGKVFALFLFLSVLAYVNVLLMSNPKVIYAMGKDGVLPSYFGRVSAKNQVPVNALMIFSLTAIVVVVFAGTFEKVLSFSIFLDSIGMVLSAGTIFILRAKHPVPAGSLVYKVRPYPVVPILFMAAYIFVAISIAIDSPFSAVMGTCLVALFTVLYFINPKKKADGH